MELKIIFVIFGIANIVLLSTLLFMLKSYLIEHKHTTDVLVSAQKEELQNIKQNIGTKLEKLKSMLSFKESCFVGIGGGCNIIYDISQYDSRHKYIYINSDALKDTKDEGITKKFL